ncbi:MAG: molecular chaperone DnaJ [Spiribacter sp.]|jgi:hypothetical protein|nr:molecular chaperone DnaJ [Spiribacter sp.]MDR9489424.1 molecular chaperone DnaJ [Spiribacter sp.]
MIRLISFILLVGFLAFMLSPRLRRWLSARAPMLFLGSIAIAGIVLAATGRLNWIFAAIGAALPMVWRLASLLRFLPWITRLMGAGAHARTQRHQHNERPNAQPNAGAMSHEEAAEMLGVSTDADRDSIMAAHRRLIQRLHPDRGGTDYLAARLNEARDRLLQDLPS